MKSIFLESRKRGLKIMSKKTSKKLDFYEFHLWLRQKKTYRILNWHSFHPVGTALQIHILVGKKT